MTKSWQVIKEIVANRRLTQSVFLLKPNESGVVPAPWSYALSLCPEPSSSNQSIFAWANTDNPALLHLHHQENKPFIEFMQHTISQSHEELCYLLNSRASRVGEGWLSLVDERAQWIYGRTPDPEDVIGFCRAQGGQVLAQTYQSMPSYRLITLSGIFSLPTALHNKLVSIK